MTQTPLGRPAFRLRASDGLGFALAVLVGTPALCVAFFGLMEGGGETWRHIVATSLWGSTLRTLGLLLLTGVLVLAAGVPTAWLVVTRNFPGRAWFEWLLVLPLAAPGYVLAYAYADVMGVSGPLQTSLRNATGWTARDYWFPQIASLWGCAFVLAAALFPYVYLAARAAFTAQSASTLEAARSLGAGPWRRFVDVALPAARPAIVAGLALALMEAAADYGAASYLGVQTLTVGVFKSWSSFGDAAAAARLALFLALLALGLYMIERTARGRAGSAETSSRTRSHSRSPLSRVSAMGAT
ncbi:MAG: ABC transporter permease subunit, partial [Pseudomonadota bacterium]